MANNAIENAEKILELTEKQEKLKKIIASYAKTISEQEGKASEHQKARLNGLKIAFETRKKELKIAQDITDTQEELRSLTDKEAMASFDIAGHKKKILKTADSIRKLESLGTKDAIQKADKLKEELKMTKGVFDRRKNAISAVQAQQKVTENLLGNLNTSVSALSGMKDQAILFGRALMANPYMLLLAGFALLIMYIKDSVSFSMKLSKELGVSASQASKLNNEIGFVRRKFLDMVGIDISAISNQLLEDFGDVNMLSGKTVQEIGTMALGMGTTGQNLVKVSKTMQSVLPSISSSAMAMESMSMFAAIAKENGAATGKVMDDLAENTEVFAAFGKDGGENIAMAAIQARKLGLNLSQTAKIADSLLDFESSIEKEMEASLLIGKQLNYNRARQLALEGDIAGAAAEVMDQIGGQEEFSRLNVIQRRALAESIGVSVDELSRLASGDLNVSSDAVEPMDAVAEGQKMLSDAMGGVEKAISTATFGLKAVTKLMAKNRAEKAVKKKVAEAGTETAVKNAAKLISNVPIAKSTGLPDARMTGKATQVLKKELGEESAEKLIIKVAGKGTEKAIEAGGEALAKSAGKKIPFVGAVIGGGLALKELNEGDYLGAVGELTSGLVSMIPVFGTAASVAIDAGLLARDVMAANETLATLEDDMAREKQNLNQEEQRILEEAIAGGTEKQQEFIDKFDKWFGGGSMNDIAEIMAKMLEEEKKVGAAVTNLGAD